MSRVNKVLALSLLAGYLSAAGSVELIDKPYVHKQGTQESTNNSVPTYTRTVDVKSNLAADNKPAANEPISVESKAVSESVAVPAQHWSLKAADVNYAGAIQRWAEHAGYQVRWDANKHFYIEAENTFVGTFEDAVTAVLSNPAVAYSSYPLEVCFYPNTPPLARITRRGDQVKECK